MATRRSFIKSTSAMGIFSCLPTIEVRKGITLDLMKRFCDPESFRYRMDAPFVENGNASATDGRVGIRVFDSMRIADTDSPLKLPPLGNAFEQLWKPTRPFRDLPSSGYIAASDLGCWHCNARGFMGVLRKCEVCDGTGEDWSDTNIDDWGDPFVGECKKCCGGFLSNEKCPVCKSFPFNCGKGAEIAVDDDLRIDARFHRLAMELPGARWSVSDGYDHTVTKPPNTGKVCLIEFEGGQGMVMGLSTDRAQPTQPNN